MRGGCGVVVGLLWGCGVVEMGSLFSRHRLETKSSRPIAGSPPWDKHFVSRHHYNYPSPDFETGGS